jgi:hypothetical protein
VIVPGSTVLFLFAFNIPTDIYRDKLTCSVSRLFIILLFSVPGQSTCFGYKKINLAGFFWGSDVESQYLLRNEHYIFFHKLSLYNLRERL